jgi:hypothetical protein
MNDFYSSEDARLESERHRREIADILDALSDKISHGVQQAEHQINKPVNLIRDYPWVAIAVGVGVGFLLAGTASRRKEKEHRVDPRVLQELERAYLEGRVDERQNRPTRIMDDWEPSGRQLDSRKSGDFSLAGLLLDVSKPMLRGLTAGLGSLLGSRLRRD